MFPVGGQWAGHDTIHSAGPDGGIGRHSGLKIVKVYGYIGNKYKINKDL